MVSPEEINKWIDKNREDILHTVSDVVRIKTVNHPPDGDEKPGQEYLYNWISKFFPKDDIDVFEVDDVKNVRENSLFDSIIDGVERNYKDRPNVVARLKGYGEGRSIVFSGHMDTVPVLDKEWEVFKDPFSGKIKDGKMYGRGILDMKAGTVSGFYALKCLKDLKVRLKGDVFAESVVDEELGGVNGTIACRLRYPDIDFAILSEPTDLTIGIETRGGSVWKATVGEEGPGGFSQKENPIDRLSEFVLALEEYDLERNRKMVFPDNFNGERLYKLLIFLINSGGENFLKNAAYVPTEGCIYFLIPTRPYTKEKELWGDLLKFMEERSKRSSYIKTRLPEIKRILRFFNGNISDTEHKAFLSIKKAYENFGIKYEEKAFPAPCDAEAFKLVSGTEVVLIGPKGDRLHGMDEYVEIDSIFNLIRIMVYTAIDFCR
jgi:acetylornithine deacetylase